MKGIVTINTDASYHSEFKVGAYAFWIVSDMGRICMSGAFKERVKNPSEAEIQCILNAIHVFKKQRIKDIYKIIVNTDSLNAIHIFKNDKQQIKRWGLKWGDGYREKFNKMGLSKIIEFRHVKAHKETSTARSWVNDWCDKSAKEQLWKKINNTN